MNSLRITTFILLAICVTLILAADPPAKKKPTGGDKKGGDKKGGDASKPTDKKGVEKKKDDKPKAESSKTNDPPASLFGEGAPKPDKKDTKGKGKEVEKKEEKDKKDTKGKGKEVEKKGDKKDTKGKGKKEPVPDEELQQFLEKERNAEPSRPVDPKKKGKGEKSKPEPLGKQGKENLKVLTADEYLYLVDINIVEKFGFLKNTILDWGLDTVKESHLDAAKAHSLDFKKCIEWAEHHKDTKDEDYLPSEEEREIKPRFDDWETEFHNAVPLDDKFPLMKAADYLENKMLVCQIGKTIADKISGKSPEEIRKTFGIKADA